MCARKHCVDEVLFIQGPFYKIQGLLGKIQGLFKDLSRFFNFQGLFKGLMLFQGLFKARANHVIEHGLLHSTSKTYLVSNTDSHHPDTLFSLCLTTNSDQVFHDKSRSREEAILSEARVASKSYEWSGFFHVAALSSILCSPIFSTYPHCNTWIHYFLHCEIGPRNPTVLLSSEPLFILWSREGNFDNRAGVVFSKPFCALVQNRRKAAKMSARA